MCNTTVKGFFPKCRDLFRQWNTVRKEADALLVMFPAQYLVPLAWKLTRFPRKKLFFDAFISLYDTQVHDRKTVSAWSPFAWFLWMLDWLSLHMADVVITDTKAHADFFVRAFGIQPERTTVVYLSARADLFAPRRKESKVPGSLEIFFYGSYIPLQGIRWILEAFSLLEKRCIPFHATLVGGGQEYKAMRALSSSLGLRSVDFLPFTPLAELPKLMAQSDLCLGIFGTSEKAARVIPHKVYDAVAMQIPVITRDSPAIRERFHNNDQVILVSAGDPKALATAIARMATDL